MRTLHRSQEGMALVMVLGVVAAAMMLIAHLILFTTVLARESYQVSGRGTLRYQAESTAETLFWLHLTDRRLFSNRTMGEDAAGSLREDSQFPPVMLDGRPHYFDDGTGVGYLLSGENGIKPGNLNELKSGLDAADDADFITRIDEFIAAYQDYTDKDDLTSLNGFEAEDYAAAGFFTLPRNNAMNFKAELYWLPGWADVLDMPLCIVPPRGISYSFSNNGKPSFFDATDAQFCRYLGISADSQELEMIHEALEQWRENGIAVEESLDFDLLTSVKSNFSFTEAGVALCVAAAADAGNEIRAVCRVTRVARFGNTGFFADKQKECLSIWEKKWE
ncbi:MAG: hypothetical protein J6S21_03555 [Victivallales bacterium]|nr:hypothetical protein [Victivallales bacterium]